MQLPKGVQHLYEKHKKHWLTIAFLCGFVTDLLLLNKIDDIIDNLILLFYVTLSMSSLALLYAGVAGRFGEVWSLRARTYAPLLTQYAFGGLLSGMLIFYGRSGSWFESWPFLLLILFVIYGNETVQNRAGRLIFTMAMLFIGLLSYVVLVVPVITGMMGAWVFVGSSILAIGIMQVFIAGIAKIVPRFIELHKRSLIFAVGLIFAIFQFLYFTNIIPPIPLSLYDVGIYHSVVKFDDGTYQLSYEKPAWWQFFTNSDTTFHAAPNDAIYCFASVFAPGRLETDIYHHWQYYSDDQGKWISHSRLSYPIAGGRDQGFRGYTLIQTIRNGKWRCTVETARGQVLGSETFTVESGAPGEIVTRVE